MHAYVIRTGTTCILYILPKPRMLYEYCHTTHVLLKTPRSSASKLVQPIWMHIHIHILHPNWLDHACTCIMSCMSACILCRQVGVYVHGT